MERFSLSRRTALLGGIGAGAMVAIPGTARAITAPDSPAAPIAADGSTVIRSEALEVSIDAAFPRIISTRLLAIGVGMSGNRVSEPVLQINGINRIPQVSAAGTASSRSYVMTVPEDQMVITAVLSVQQDRLTFELSSVEENGSTKLNTFWLPRWNPVTVSAELPDATLASALLPRTANYDPDTTSSDSITKVADLPTNNAEQATTLAFLYDDKIAVASETNSIEAQRRMVHLTREVAGIKTTGIWSAQWTYRTNDGQVHDLPRTNFIFTGDRNGDGVVDWQDAAIAFREIMYKPIGSEGVRKDVAFQVAINKNSLAERPFLRTLDDIRKIHLYTDGLGQSIELKGYQAGGHDTSHPDYGDNISRVAGGLDHLKTLIEEAKKLNCRIGVHINATEEYLGAKNFSWNISSQKRGSALGWRGQGQAFKIDQAYDQSSGSFDSRLQVLKDNVPGLSFIYLDVWQNFQADPSAQVVRSIQSRGWSFLTEFETLCWPEPIWYHKPTWYPDDGINSKLIRMAYSQYKDVWLQNDAAPAGTVPLLRGPNQAGFMGFSSTAQSVAVFLKTTFTQNLPVKFLQHFAIMNYGADTVTFSDGVKASNAGNRYRIYQNDKAVYDNGEAFIPWDTDPDSDGGNFVARKVYAWSSTGIAKTWDLPQSWLGQTQVTLFELTDLGKAAAKSVPVVGGQVRLLLKKDTPYVVYPTDPALLAGIDTGLATPAAVGLGQSDLVKDGYFYHRSLAYWQPQNALAAPTIATDIPGSQVRGLQSLQFSSPLANSVRQTVTGLVGGQTYVASVFVAVQGKRKASLVVTPGDAAAQEVYADSSPWQNKISESYQYGSNLQRMTVKFSQPAGQNSAVLELKAEASASGAIVWFNSVRLAPVPGDAGMKGHYFYEDFENLDQGWGPFVYAGQRGTAAEFIADLHEGYSLDIVSGNHSLRSLDNSGPIWKTLPQTLRFEADEKYRISFKYLCDTADVYSVDFRSISSSTPIATVQLKRTSDRPLDSAPPAGTSPSGWNDTLPPQYPATPAIAEFTVDTAGFSDGYLQFNKALDAAGKVIKSTLSIDDLTVDVV